VVSFYTQRGNRGSPPRWWTRQVGCRALHYARHVSAGTALARCSSDAACEPAACARAAGVLPRPAKEGAGELLPAHFRQGGSGCRGVRRHAGRACSGGSNRHAAPWLPRPASSQRPVRGGSPARACARGAHPRERLKSVSQARVQDLRQCVLAGTVVVMPRRFSWSMRLGLAAGKASSSVMLCIFVEARRSGLSLGLE
jgi:hypothetical protein